MKLGGLRPWQLSMILGVCLVLAAAALTWTALRSSAHKSTAAPSARPSTATVVTPPTKVCGNRAVLGRGPAAAPSGAITVPAGDDAAVNFSQAGATYWFAPGTHTLGGGQFTQIIPGQGARFTGAPGAVLDGQHTNLYAFGGDSGDVTISYLTIQNFGTIGGNQNQGVVNENSEAGWTVEYSTIQDNAGAGAMLGSDNTLSHDCLTRNQQYGFNAYSTSGPSHLLVEDNEISDNDTYNWEAHQAGCGCSGGGKFWDVNGAVVTGNWVHGNDSVGLWADTNNRGFNFTGNYIADNYSYGLIYEISYNAQIKDNTFVRNGIGAGPHNQGFPTSAIYISESGSDSRVPSPYSHSFEITGNNFINNWGGVILWENSNRYCNSPANTSSGVCTLVAPSVATLQSCDAQNIAHTPYYSDCRWKTQNVDVSDNKFDFDPASVGSSCTLANECGFQGLFSEYGTYPSWSPYKAATVENHISFGQNNHFSQNTYRGPWRFMVQSQGKVVTWALWRGKPFSQDAGSTITATP
jgi:Right handed beta helix region